MQLTLKKGSDGKLVKRGLSHSNQSKGDNMNIYYKNKDNLYIEEGINRAIEPIIDLNNGSFYIKISDNPKHRTGGEARWVIHHCDYCGKPYFRRKYGSCIFITNNFNKIRFTI